MTVMQPQLTTTIIPSNVGIEGANYENERKMKELGFTELVSLKSILTPEELQYVTSQGSALSMMYIESSNTKLLVPMKTIISVDGFSSKRDTMIPKGFSARTTTHNEQRGLVGFPTVSGG
jgi:hypothetical protein